MRYAICDRQKSVEKGFNADTHRRKEQEIILNEKEVMLSQNLTGETFEKRISEVGGRQISEKDLIIEVKQGDWK